MQSCMEKRSMDERHDEITRNDYNRENIYNDLHPNARATGDAKGKGTGHPGGTKILRPNCNGVLNVVDYSNYDTAISSNAGNDSDNQARTTALTRSLYNENNRYSAELVDTTANIREGQYSVHQSGKIA